MVIIEDTRNQVGKHKRLNRQLAELGHQVVRSKLYVGDYQPARGGSVSIDTKKDMLELAMDLCADHKRFRAECERAREAGIRLVILTEELLPTGGIANWKSPTYHTTTASHKAGDPITRVTPEMLYKTIHTMSTRYGVEFHFCHKDETGQVIHRILTNEEDKK